MEWEVCFHQDIAERLSKLPSDWRPQFDAALKKLASDPKGLGHKPVLPYVWKGPLWDFRVRDGDGRLVNVTVFFLFDDDPNVRKIYIHDLNLISVFYGDRQKQTGPAETSTGPVVEIPALQEPQFSMQQDESDGRQAQAAAVPEFRGTDKAANGSAEEGTRQEG